MTASVVERLSLARVNRALVAVILVLLALAVYQVVFARPAALPGIEIAPAVEPVAGGPAPTVSIPQLDTYTSLRNPFVPPRPGPGPGPGPTTNPVVRISDFKLIGVSWDPAQPDESEAIIRSESRRQTYFVRQGQSIAEAGADVIKVERERVVLRQSGKEIEVK